ncbi:hypothetical protein GCM10027610_082350 [Dactylosporangium cerinum]
MCQPVGDQLGHPGVAAALARQPIVALGHKGVCHVVQALEVQRLVRGGLGQRLLREVPSLSEQCRVPQVERAVQDHGRAHESKNLRLGGGEPRSGGLRRDRQHLGCDVGGGIRMTATLMQDRLMQTLILRRELHTSS